MNIIIIEDENISANYLKKVILEESQENKVWAILNTIDEALEFINCYDNIDLIFSDIQIANRLCFDIYSNTNREIPIIFCTAYDNYFLDAIKTFCLDYILKPITKESVGSALNKYHKIKSQFVPPKISLKDIIEVVNLKTYKKDPKILVWQADTIIPLSLEEIALFYVENSYTYAYTFKFEKYKINENLDKIQSKYKNELFRANRQYLLNRKVIKNVTLFFKQTLLVNLIIPYPEQIIISRRRTTSFLKWLSNENEE